ncbi:MAG: DUF6090 family protein [Maribacter sp.]|nr:DUF6090 family protein [Maribacter sp.]
MINFFRKIRKKLANNNKPLKYLRYAVGEIVLVVIGILLALQINNWNENYKNTKKERGYLINLQQDLISDSLRLNELKNNFEIAVKSKRIFENLLNGKNITMDSLIIHFMNQHDFVNDFIPNSTTLDELKNSNGLNLISNPILRRQIVTLYNSYDDLIIKLKLGAEKSQIILAYTSKFVKNIDAITNDEIYTLLDDNYFNNQIRLNYLYTQLTITLKAYQNCFETLNLIKEELKNDQIL